MYFRVSVQIKNCFILIYFINIDPFGRVSLTISFFDQDSEVFWEVIYLDIFALNCVKEIPSDEGHFLKGIDQKAYEVRLKFFAFTNSIIIYS